MHIKEVFITPQDAVTMLAHNAHNRGLDRNRVQRYAQDMREGRWQLTHQAIGITSSGMLVDGQHRLTAVIDSGCTVPMMVCYDADPATFGVVDQGKVRTGQDIWRIGGKPGSGIAAIAKIVYLYGHYHEEGDSWPLYSRLSTPDTVFSWAQRHIPHSPDVTIADACSQASRYEIRFRKEVKKLPTVVGATLAIMQVYGGYEQEVIWEAAFEPLLKCIGLEAGTPVYSFHRLMQAREARKHEGCFGVHPKGISVHELAQDRLACLLFYVKDVLAGSPRAKYSFPHGVALLKPSALRAPALTGAIDP